MPILGVVSWDNKRDYKKTRAKTSECAARGERGEVGERKDRGVV